MNDVFLREHEDEPLLGLPERLPKGERLLWQGSPSLYPLARNALHLNKVIVYFCLIMLWQQGSHWQLHGTLSANLLIAPLLSLLVVSALLILLAYLYARTTVYSISNKRIVIRYGIAVPITLNIPFADVEQASAFKFRHGSGNIAISVSCGVRLSWVVLWPNARPWRFMKPQPMIRAIAAVDDVALVLQQAVAEAAAANDTARPVTLQPIGLDGSQSGGIVRDVVSG